MQVEAVLELIPEVVAGQHDVLGDERDEVRVLVDRERLEHASRGHVATSSDVSNGRFIFVSAKP